MQEALTTTTELLGTIAEYVKPPEIKAEEPIEDVPFVSPGTAVWIKDVGLRDYAGNGRWIATDQPLGRALSIDGIEILIIKRGDEKWTAKFKACGAAKWPLQYEGYNTEGQAVKHSLEALKAWASEGFSLKSKGWKREVSRKG